MRHDRRAESATHREQSRAEEHKNKQNKDYHQHLFIDISFFLTQTLASISFATLYRRTSYHVKIGSRDVQRLVELNLVMKRKRKFARIHFEVEGGRVMGQTLSLMMKMMMMMRRMVKDAREL
jgi:hypothetical protein